MASRQIPLFPDLRAGPSLRDIADLVHAGGADALTGAVRRADAARYQEIEVRSALVEVRGMPFRWALNPYRGCTHACQYCYARKYQRHLELGAGDDFSSLIFVKTNVADRLAREVARPSWTRERVSVGTATDPYQPIEGHCRLTRRCLEVLAAADTPFSIVTKGPMAVRDVDVLRRATEGAGCQVFFSVPSVDEDAWQRLEPGTAPPEQRLRAARRLRDAGVDAAVLMMPLMPGITTSRASLTRTVAAIRDAGLPIAGAGVGRLDPGVREFFFEFLTREYPALVDGYHRLYQRTDAKGDYVAAVKQSIARAKTDAAG